MSGDASTPSNKVCPICTVNPLAAGETECSICRDGPDAYVALQDIEPCKRCGEGETWSVKGPGEVWIGQSWRGDSAEWPGRAARLRNAAAINRRSRMPAKSTESAVQPQGKLKCCT